MGLLGALFGKSQTSGFVFSDGRALTPEQYGFVAVKNSYQSAQEDVRELFSATQPAGALALSVAVRRTGLSAAMFLTPLYTSPYIAHAANLASTSSAVVDRVFVGVSDSWADFRLSSGSSLPRQDVLAMLGATRRFGASWLSDLNVVLQRDTGSYSPQPLPSLEAAFHLLHTNLSDPTESVESWLTELQSPGGFWLVQMLESAVLSTSQALIEPLRVQYRGDA
jgi:hypothetical protein